MKDYAPSPRDSQVLVDIFAVKELLRDVGQRLLRLLVKDHVLPTGLVDLIPKIATQGPVAVKHIYQMSMHISMVVQIRDAQIT